MRLETSKFVPHLMPYLTAKDHVDPGGGDLLKRYKTGPPRTDPGPLSSSRLLVRGGSLGWAAGVQAGPASAVSWDCGALAGWMMNRALPHSSVPSASQPCSAALVEGRENTVVELWVRWGA